MHVPLEFGQHFIGAPGVVEQLVVDGKTTMVVLRVAGALQCSERLTLQGSTSYQG